MQDELNKLIEALQDAALDGHDVEGLLDRAHALRAIGPDALASLAQAAQGGILSEIDPHHLRDEAEAAREYHRDLGDSLGADKADETAQAWGQIARWIA